MSSPALPRIGIFDSGIGGLSVLRAVQRRLPAAALTYIADSLHTPWGERPAAWVSQRCTQLAGWLIAQGSDLVLVACNTGTTQAIGALRSRWPGQHFVGVEPGIKPAVAASRNGRVAVMATTGTLRSARVRQLVATHAGGAQVLQLPCPGLADAIEAAGIDPQPLQQQLAAIARTIADSGADTVVLGCTHYPLVADALQARLGPGVQLLDTADAVARRVASLLALPAPAGPPDPPGPPGTPAGSMPPPPLRLLATAHPGALQQAAQRWLDHHGPVDLLQLPGQADPGRT